MDNLDFGYGLGIIILLFGLLSLTIRTLLIFTLTFNLTKKLVPYISRFMGFGEWYASSSRHYLFSFLLVWLFTVPLVGMLLDAIWSMVPSTGDLPEIERAFHSFHMYLLVLTLWYYDLELTEFHLKSFRKSLGTAFIFMIAAALLSLPFQVIGWFEMIDGITGYLIYSHLQGIVIVGITLILIKRNVRKTVPESTVTA